MNRTCFQINLRYEKKPHLENFGHVYYLDNQTGGFLMVLLCFHSSRLFVIIFLTICIAHILCLFLRRELESQPTRNSYGYVTKMPICS